MLVQLSQLTVVDSTFVGNVADQFGGALVQLSVGTMDIRDTVFDANVAGEGGGAVAVATASDSDR